jgi:hypothetical protein
MDYTPAVLKNKGIPVEIAKLREEDGAWVSVFDSEGVLETEEFNVKFTHNIIADIEELWDGLQEWQVAMESKPVSTLRRTFGLLLGEPLDKTGTMMVEGNLTEYTNAVGVAWALANGVDPTVASRLLKQAEAAVDSQTTMLNEELNKTIEEMENEATRGDQPSPLGAKQAKGTKTSGKPAPPKS